MASKTPAKAGAKSNGPKTTAKAPAKAAPKAAKPAVVEPPAPEQGDSSEESAAAAAAARAANASPDTELVPARDLKVGEDIDTVEAQALITEPVERRESPATGDARGGLNVMPEHSVVRDVTQSHFSDRERIQDESSAVRKVEEAQNLADQGKLDKIVEAGPDDTRKGAHYI